MHHCMAMQSRATAELTQSTTHFLSSAPCPWWNAARAASLTAAAGVWHESVSLPVPIGQVGVVSAASFLAYRLPSQSPRAPPSPTV